MWVMTSGGMFSAVLHDTDPTLVVVRTRSARDVQHLDAHLKIMGAPSEVLTYAVSDYPWRTITTRTAWAQFLHFSALGIDYGNYKSRVAETNPQRAHTYHDVWTALLPIEDEPDADTAHHRNPYAPQPYLDDWAEAQADAFADSDHGCQAALADPFYVQENQT